MKNLKRLTICFTGAALLVSTALHHDALAQSKTGQQSIPHNPKGPDFAFTVPNKDPKKAIKLPIDIDLLGPNGELTADFLGQFDVDFYRFVNVQIKKETVINQRVFELAVRLFSDKEAENIARTVQQLIDDKKLKEAKFIGLLEQDLVQGSEGLKTLHYIINAPLHLRKRPKQAKVNASKVWRHLAMHMTKKQHEKLKTDIEKLLKVSIPILETHRKNQRSKLSPSP